ncbi:50S ribosomal protein L11 methyltransferase [Hahella aquimaris]|uniref:class I SAM-dependent methyltransferase n=1 Tax=Hahella sp. HNIBRBA332 TaxID=3015983 RepID=UPI00273B696B|nr:50S ribosomal protein L11 methyltransferase [Hahella sp. HNIBRBA332]WLQ12461.1 50S ribosomal protein L11 methyltransferase [Hahella sp. HNIBRBA332]
MLNRLLPLLQRTLPRSALRLAAPSLIPEIRLYLFDPEVMEGPLSHDEAQAVVAEPAYWSFCWASGQVLARYILDHPEVVKGKTVWDIGAGSGVVAIAAALAGAADVLACDLDAAAQVATIENARLNGVWVTVCETLPPADKPDVITAADVLYDRENLQWLPEWRDKASKVLLADSRVRNLAAPGYELKKTASGRTFPDLNEFEEFNEVRIYESGRHIPSEKKGD